MPNLADLTDYDPMGNVTGVAPEADGVRRVYIGDAVPEGKPEGKPSLVDGIVNKLLGLNGEERYQLWPEKVVREGLSAAGDVLTGKTPQWQVDPVTGDVHTSSQMIEGAQAMSALAGSGGLAGTTDATLGATPFLRPALKYKDRLYKGKEGQAHQDVIPDALYPEFQKMAMSGDDISHYNFGFHNDKGQFLSREAALEYGINTGLIDPAAGKFGALTSTLLADSSKPGMAIEATAKATPDWGIAKNIDANLTGDLARAIDTWVGGPHNALDIGYGGGGWHPGKLKAVLNNPELKTQLDEAIKPFKDDLRAKYGDTVPLYRYHGKLPEGAKSDRELLSFSSDPEVPKHMAGIKKEAPVFSDKDIAAKEKEFADKGEVKIGRYTLTKNEFGSLDINDPKVGGFLTDTDSVSAWMKDLNSEAHQYNTSQADKSKMIYKQDVPIDDIVYATDRFGQKEIIVRNKNKTLFADSSKEGAALQSIKEPTFFSALEHNVSKIAQDKMTGDQWLGTLANKPGIKPEELQWSGLKDYLEQNKGKPVTKADIEAHLAQNKTELGETVKGVAANEIRKAEAKQLLDQLNKMEAEGMPNISEYTAIQNKLNDVRNKSQAVTTKYQQYQVPGGENYREVLMTLPEKPKLTAGYEVVKHPSGEGFALRDKDGNLKLAPEGYRNEGQPLKWDSEELAAKVGAPAYNKDTANYKSSHWDEPNILAHMRMNDRTIDGKKSLHLEEVQSDWHQDGRKQGYKSGDEKALSKELYAKRDEIDKLLNNRKREDLSSEEYMKYEKLSKEMGDINTKHYAAKYGVPDAPFKKNWHELALKRAIREAAENGYDRLSWTAGEHHPTNPKNLKQTGPEADAADKGMQGFYNNMLPKSVEKLTGQKVHVAELPGKLSNKMGEKAAHTKIYYIDIPQSVKDTALGKGFPLYSSSHMFTPVVGNPFNTENEK